MIAIFCEFGASKLNFQCKIKYSSLIPSFEYILQKGMDIYIYCSGSINQRNGITLCRNGITSVNLQILSAVGLTLSAENINHGISQVL